MIRILIVDDHEIVRRGIREVFADEFPSAHIGEAQSSKEALEAVMAKPWDIVVLDINIPGRSGLEVLEEVRRIQPQTAVLIVSAYPEEEFAIRSFKLGAAGYLNKARASDELIAAVKKALTGGKYVPVSLAEKLAASLGSDVEEAAHESLSGRELQVLRMIALGKTIKEIAAELSLSEKTVATYRSRISEKLGLNSNVEITRFAMKHKLVE